MNPRPSPDAAAPRVLFIPDMELPYYSLLVGSLRAAGCSVVRASRLPRRGLFFDTPLSVIHLHMVEIMFCRGRAWHDLFNFLHFLLITTPALKSRGGRLVWTCHELTPHEGPRRLAHLFTGILAHFADEIIVHNHTLRHALPLCFAGARPHRISFIAHGGLAPYYAASTAKAAGGAPPPSLCVFASIGYMRFDKGTDLILAAFRRIQDPNARLVVAGVCKDDVYFDQLVRLADGDDRIRLLRGRLDDDELVALHLQAHVAVFGFRDCPTSGSLITALSLGRHVIAPRLGHAAELLRDHEAALYDPALPIEGLEKHMREALGDPDLCLARGARSRLAIATPDWPCIARATLSVYGLQQSRDDAPAAVV